MSEAGTTHTVGSGLKPRMTGFLKVTVELSVAILTVNILGNLKWLK